MRLIGLILGVLCLAACDGTAPGATSPGEGQAQRIISLDYCADQYVLALVERDRILALSPDARKSFSYLRHAAEGVRQVRPNAEDVLALQPDLIVRSYGGGPKAASFFEASGTPVLQVGWANGLGGVRQVLEDMAEGLDAGPRGDALLTDFDARLAAITPHEAPSSVLYVTAGGVTAGEGTLIHDMFTAAGLANFETGPGWRPLPLERMTREQPDIIAPVFFNKETRTQNSWSATRHPVAQRQLSERPRVELESAWTSCGGWFLIDAIEALAAEGDAH